MWREGDAGGKSALSMPVLWSYCLVKKRILKNSSDKTVAQHDFNYTCWHLCTPPLQSSAPFIQTSKQNSPANKSSPKHADNPQKSGLLESAFSANTPREKVECSTSARFCMIVLLTCPPEYSWARLGEHFANNLAQNCPHRPHFQNAVGARVHWLKHK